MLLPFHLILTSGPILLANNHQKVVFSLWMLGFRCVLLEFCKNMGDPYYEPTVVVHDKQKLMEENHAVSLVGRLQQIKRFVSYVGLTLLVGQTVQ